MAAVEKATGYRIQEEPVPTADVLREFREATAVWLGCLSNTGLCQIIEWLRNDEAPLWRHHFSPIIARHCQPSVATDEETNQAICHLDALGFGDSFDVCHQAVEKALAVLRKRQPVPTETFRMRDGEAMPKLGDRLLVGGQNGDKFTLYPIKPPTDAEAVAAEQSDHSRVELAKVILQERPLRLRELNKMDDSVP